MHVVGALYVAETAARSHLTISLCDTLTVDDVRDASLSVGGNQDAGNHFVFMQWQELVS
jgi:hypothetical protein